MQIRNFHFSFFGMESHNFRRRSVFQQMDIFSFSMIFIVIDEFSLYVLLPHLRAFDDTLENYCFQIFKKSFASYTNE